MSRIQTVRIVDSTLREGEQFAHADFTSQDRERIARQLDEFGVDSIEMTSPAASPQSAEDLRRIAGMGLQARVITHTRCNLDDVTLAVRCGAQGVSVLFGTSHWLRKHSHGRDMRRILDDAQRTISFLRREGVEVRFSCEDSFRTPLDELLTIYGAVEEMGVDRVGVADTVGQATPDEVTRVVSAVREHVGTDIEFHAHDDGGCSVANAYSALAAGATHVDTTILGIGERNGITPLSALMARLYLVDPKLVQRYALARLPSMDRMVADLVGVSIPFNACISGETAFTHKAGLHTKAVISEPRTYEVLVPEAFGRSREVLVGHRLTGRHALADRARTLEIHLGPDALLAATAQVKSQADTKRLSLCEVDGILRGHAHTNIAFGNEEGLQCAD